MNTDQYNPQAAVTGCACCAWIALLGLLTLLASVSLLTWVLLSAYG